MKYLTIALLSLSSFTYANKKVDAIREFALSRQHIIMTSMEDKEDMRDFDEEFYYLYGSNNAYYELISFIEDL